MAEKKLMTVKKVGKLMAEGKNGTDIKSKRTGGADASPFFSRTIVIFVTAVFCCMLWGSAFPCIKTGYKLFDIASDEPASQILFAGVRFTLAGILVAAAGSVMAKKPLLPKKTSWGKLVVLSLLQTSVHYTFFYIGLAHTSGVNSSIITGSTAFLSILVSVFIFKKEKLTASKIAGCVLGFSAVIAVTLADGSLSLDVSLLGEGFVLIAALMHAFSSNAMKIYSRDDNPVMLSGWQFVIGGLTMIACGLALGGSLDPCGPSAFALLLYMAFISACAYTLWSVLLKFNPVSKVAIFEFSNPVFGVILSALILGETSEASGLNTIIALALLSAGIIIVNRKKGPL